jgi:hypothetical protein
MTSRFSAPSLFDLQISSRAGGVVRHASTTMHGRVACAVPVFNTQKSSNVVQYFTWPMLLRVSVLREPPPVEKKNVHAPA